MVKNVMKRHFCVTFASFEIFCSAPIKDALRGQIVPHLRVF
jgi:hypothetical protein